MRSGHIPGRIVTAVAGTSIVLGGCFTTSTDYQNDAEDFILTDEDLATSLGTADDPLVFDVGDVREAGRPERRHDVSLHGDRRERWRSGSSRSRSATASTYEVIIARDPRTNRLNP